MKSYLKFLSRNKLYTAIQALGLALSLAFVILIGSYVLQQRAIVKENPDGERIYSMGIADFLYLSSYWDKEELDMKIPEVEASTRIRFSDKAKVEYNGVKQQISLTTVDVEFFDIFPYYEIEEGSVDAFKGQKQVFVSRRFARTMCPDGSSPVGKTLRMSDEEYTVCGVLADFDHSMMMPTDVVCNAMDDPIRQKSAMAKYMTFGNYLILFRVSEGTDREELAAKLEKLFKENYAVLGERNYVLRSLPEIYDEGATPCFTVAASRSMRTSLTLVVFLLLASALFNYINLALALGGRRAKEMATRRLLGENRSGIMLRQLGESIIFTAVSFILALLVAEALEPMMNRLLLQDPNQSVPLSLRWNLRSLLLYLAAIIVTGLAAGVIPAVESSNTEPIDVVNGRFRRHSRMVLSRIFIVLQSTLAVALVAMVLVMERQMHHLMQRPMNSNTKDLYVLQVDFDDKADLFNLAEQLRQQPCLRTVALGAGVPGFIGWSGVITMPEDDTDEIEFGNMMGDTAYFRLLQLHTKQPYSQTMPGDVWLSSSMTKTIDANDSTQWMTKYLTSSFKLDNGRIVGEYEDVPVHAHDLMSNSIFVVIDPNMMASLTSYDLLIQTTEDHKTARKVIDDEYRKYVEATQKVYTEPSMSFYLDELMSNVMKSERNSMRLIEIFTSLAVILSLLGLFAMSAYFSGEQTKQIAIRKVFGAEMEGEVWRNVRQYMLLVCIACCVGIPLAAFAASRYLEQFVYRIDSYGWLFVAAVLIVLAFSLLAVLSQVLRAARTNPAEALKKE